MNREDVLETDVFSILNKLPYVQSPEDAACEAVLEEYQNSLLFNLDDVSLEALTTMLQDVYVGDFVEKAKGVAFATKQKLKNSAGVLVNFVRTLQRISYNKIVNEKFIRKRFEGLKASYINYFYNGVGSKMSYVEAPTYDTMASRLNGLHSCVMFLKKAAESSTVSNIVDNDTYAKLVDLSKGALSIKSSNKGLINHLVWNAPKIEKWYISGSKFAKPENINNLCNSVLFVKYETMKGIDAIVKACLAKTKRLSDTADSFVSYDVEEETAEKYMHDYGSAYMLSKMVNDIVKQGIQREINTLAINYIHKLKTIKNDEI